MLPTEFVERLQALCPSHLLGAVTHSFDAAKWVAFRLNRLKVPSEPTLAALKDLGITPTSVNWAQQAGIEAFMCPPEQRQLLTHSRAASEGDIYIQGLSSMLAGKCLLPASTDWVLDLAAAPGGKTILMAEQMGNQGKISAVEAVKGRFFRLNANLNRTGVSNTTTYLKDGRAVGSLKPASFDKVLLDAPCSSEARFRSADDSTTQHWSLRKVNECAKKQKRLILSGFDALKPNGTMLYCTCSFSPEENELIVDHLLQKRPGAQLLPLELKLDNAYPGVAAWKGKNLEHCAATQRIWPNQEMDGFFLALITKQ